MDKKYEKIITAEEIIEDRIARMKYKIEHPYYDMTDEHLLLLYEVNLLLLEIQEEMKTIQTDEELLNENKEIRVMILKEYYELKKRRVL